MLYIQRALIQDKISVETLAEDLKLTTYYHPELPLVGFKYNQVESPKTHPVVREARGIVLEKGSWKLVAKGFNRFFNVGEVAEEYQTFDFSNYSVTSKEDGSLILLYYYAGQWRINTSGSFALASPPDCPYTWTELFWKVARYRCFKPEALDPNNTYVLELCTPYNKIVCRYPESQIFLLSVFKDGQEYSEDLTDSFAKELNVSRPRRWNFTNQQQAKDLVLEMNSGQVVLEGLVLRDSKNLRYKWKTDRYVALHQLHDNGNLIAPKRLVAIAQAGESEEVLTYFPEIGSALKQVSQTLQATFEDLKALWLSAKNLPTRKDFALAVKHHPFAVILFKMYGHSYVDDLQELRTQWLSWDPEKIANNLFDKEFAVDLKTLEAKL